MIQGLRFVYGESYDPYENLAREEMLLDLVPESEVWLYLWQNQKTVVIGRNQNAWQECKVETLDRDGGFLARRPSGGGAVFHDLGNLNFTFLLHQSHYDVTYQLQVILKALENLGIEAQASGRNDLVCRGCKFSGNAFHFKGKQAYHHGTLLVDVDMERLGYYLQVDASKLQAKGIESVRSRVVNLKELRQDLTIEGLKEALVEAFSQVYGLEALPLERERMDLALQEAYRKKYADPSWRLGRRIAFGSHFSQRFEWGKVELQLQVKGGVIQEAVLFSDGMEEAFLAALPQYLTGCPFESLSIIQALEALKPSLGGPLLVRSQEGDADLQERCLEEIQEMIGREMEF